MVLERYYAMMEFEQLPASRNHFRSPGGEHHQKVGALLRLRLRRHDPYGKFDKAMRKSEGGWYLHFLYMHCAPCNRDNLAGMVFRMINRDRFNLILSRVSLATPRSDGEITIKLIGMISFDSAGYASVFCPKHRGCPLLRLLFCDLHHGVYFLDHDDHGYCGYDSLYEQHRRKQQDI